MDLVSQLRSLIGPDAVLTAPGELDAYVEDWRGRFRGHALCVVLPSDTESVAAIVRACAEARVPVVAQGGNTSLCEGAVPRAEGEPAVVISLARMRRIRAVDAANQSMVVDAGCVLASIQDAAIRHDRLYPVSLGAEGSCQIGGNIATNAGGTGVLRYGNTRDNVLGLEVVLPDGRIWHGLNALRKNNTGVDLKHLFIGSEGTLGVITGATLKLHPLPDAHAIAWLAVPSPEAAVTLLGRFQQRCGGVLSAFEMMNATQLQIVLDHVPGRRAPVAPTHPWHVLVELGDTGNERGLADTLEQLLADGAEAGLVLDAVIASSAAQRDAFWTVRHSVSEGNKKAGMGINTDCAVPVSAVPTFIERATAAARAIVPDIPIIVVAHLGDGNAHFIPLASFAQWAAFDDAPATARAIKRAIDEVAHALGGTFSAEHGIGQVLTAEMALFKSPVEIELMRGIKTLLDPHALFNPGRLLPAATPQETES